MRWFPLLAVLAIASPAHADDDDMKGEKGRPVDKGTLGVGIILGEPTGITAKLYLKDDQAIQAAIGSAFIDGGFQFHVDYVFHPWILQDKESFVLPLYIGPGLRFVDHTGTASHVSFGVRGVIGMLFDFKTVPLDAFLEAAPVFGYDTDKTKGWSGFFNFGAGARYYF